MQKGVYKINYKSRGKLPKIKKVDSTYFNRALRRMRKALSNGKNLLSG